jgi:hypothetical protein
MIVMSFRREVEVMRALGIVGSQRKSGQTERLVRMLLDDVGSAIAEYLLEYLADFSTPLGMQPVRADPFPYLGVGNRGGIEADGVLAPLERANNLADSLVGAMKERRR